MQYIEDGLPIVKYNGLNTALPVDFTGAATVALPSGTTINGSSVAGIGNITSSSTTAVALAVTNTGVYTGVGVYSLVADSLTTGVAQLITVNGLTTGKGLSITSSSTGQTSGRLVSLAQTGVTTGFTGSVLAISGTSTTGSGNMLGVTGANTTAGDVVKLVNNAITVGTGTILNVSHTTSVLGAGTSMVRVASTGIDTGTTTGVLLDLSTTSGVGQTNVMLTDSSADTALRRGIVSKVTNAAAVLARPFESSNVAVVNSKFTKHYVMTDGTKTCTIWLSQDNTDPNGTLTGVAGDLLLNGPSNKPYYCSASGTTWAALV